MEHTFFLVKVAIICFKKTHTLYINIEICYKPFLIVACDGYILDCFGPYKATTTDADIMSSLFSNENSNKHNMSKLNK